MKVRIAPGATRTMYINTMAISVSVTPLPAVCNSSLAHCWASFEFDCGRLGARTIRLQLGVKPKLLCIPPSNNFVILLLVVSGTLLGHATELMRLAQSVDQPNITECQHRQRYDDSHSEVRPNIRRRQRPAAIHRAETQREHRMSGAVRSEAAVVRVDAVLEETREVKQEAQDEDDACFDASSTANSASSGTVRQQRDVLENAERMADGHIATERHGYCQPRAGQHEVVDDSRAVRLVQQLK